MSRYFTKTLSALEHFAKLDIDLSAAENSILPYLNEAQQAKLRQILDAIR